LHTIIIYKYVIPSGLAAQHHFIYKHVIPSGLETLIQFRNEPEGFTHLQPITFLILPIQVNDRMDNTCRHYQRSLCNQQHANAVNERCNQFRYTP
jgi:hypothetical protein